MAIRYTFRQMSRKPLFTAAIVLTLGVCIGAVTAVFSIVDATLLRSLPYPEPARVAQVVVRTHYQGQEGLQQNQNGATWQQLSQAVKSMDLTVYSDNPENLNFSSDGKAGYIHRQRVGAGFFRVFGIPPFMGREFAPEEDIPGGPALAVLSYDFWQRAFGADAGIVNRNVAIAGVDYRVVGVASSQFESKTDVWTPLHPSTRGEGQGINYTIAGRIRDGVTWDQADAEVASAGQVLLQRRRFSPGAAVRYGLMSLQEAATGWLAGSLWMVLGVTLMVLIAGCVNIAGMLMAQGVSRRPEIATRLAIGASRRPHSYSGGDNVDSHGRDLFCYRLFKRAAWIFSERRYHGPSPDRVSPGHAGCFPRFKSRLPLSSSCAQGCSSIVFDTSRTWSRVWTRGVSLPRTSRCWIPVMRMPRQRAGISKMCSAGYSRFPASKPQLLRIHCRTSVAGIRWSTGLEILRILPRDLRTMHTFPRSSFRHYGSRCSADAQ